MTVGNTDTYQYSIQLWEYDPALDSWKQKPDLPFPVSNAFELSGVIYLTDFEGNMYNYYPDNDYYQKISSNNSLQVFKGFCLRGYLCLLNKCREQVHGSIIYQIKHGAYGMVRFRWLRRIAGHILAWIVLD